MGSFPVRDSCYARPRQTQYENGYMSGYETGREVAQRETQKENERLKERIAKLEKFIVDSALSAQ